MKTALLLALVLAAPFAVAQLPPGTTDASSPPPAAQPDPALARAEQALQQQDYPTALKLLTTLAQKHPNDAAVLYNLGFAQDALNDEAAAADSYRRAIAANSSFFDPHLALGLLLARTGKSTEARNELATAVTLDTPNKDLKARAYRALARLDQTTNPQAATTDLLEALKLSPSSTDDDLLAAELAEQQQDYPSAEAAYRRILASHPDDPTVVAALGHLLVQLKRPSEAQAILSSALAKHPADPSLESQLAATYAAENRTGDAIALVEKLHGANPSNSDLARLLAHLYSDNRQYDKADPLYLQLLAQSPNDVGLQADHGEALLYLHNYAEAEAVLTRATQSSTAFPSAADYAHAAENLAFAASHNNHPDEVLRAVAMHDTVQPQSPATIFLAATANDSLHHRQQAIALYQKFLTAAAGKFPDQEWEAKHRLIALKNTK